MIKKDDFKQFVGLILSGIISYFVVNLANAYLLRVLGQVSYGDFSLTISLIFSLTPIYTVGITMLMTKYIPIYVEKKSLNNLNVFMKWNINTLKKSLILIIVFIILITLSRLSDVNNMVPCIFQNCKDYRHHIVDLYFLLPVSLLLMWNSSLLNAMKHSKLAQLSNDSNVICVCACIIFITEILISTPDHSGILLCIFLGFFILCFFQYTAIYFFIIKPRKLTPATISHTTVYPETSTFFLKSGVGLVTNSMAYIFLGLINMLMIEFISPSEKTLAHYVIVMKISSISMILPLAMNFLFNPYLSGLKDMSRLKRLQQLLNFNILINFIWLLICIVMFLFFRSFVFAIYEINFDNATLAICVLLVFNSIFYGVLIQFQNICLFNGHNKILFVVSAFQILSLVVLNYWMIHKFSYIGVVYSNVIVEIVCAMICWVIVRIYKINIKVFGVI